MRYTAILELQAPHDQHKREGRCGLTFTPRFEYIDIAAETDEQALELAKKIAEDKNKYFSLSEVKKIIYP